MAAGVMPSTQTMMPAAVTTSLFAQAMAGFAVPGAPQVGHAASATLVVTPLLTPVGSAAAEWHGG